MYGATTKAGFTEQSDGAGLVRALRQQLRLVQRKLGSLADRLSDAEYQLERLEASLRGTPMPVVKASLRYPSDAVARNFKWLGGGFFQIDGARLQLSHMKASLLRILAAENGRRLDALVGWKSNQEIRALLDKLAGSPSTSHGISQLIYQLRRDFMKAGLDPGLIQSHARLGRRLALRQESSPAACL